MHDVIGGGEVAVTVMELGVSVTQDEVHEGADLPADEGRAP